MHKFRSLPVTVGRDEDNDLMVDDAKLSRQHCRIARTPEGLVIEDLDSSNGTYVNGAPTTRHLLSAGDTVLIGVTPLDIEWDSETAPQSKRRRDPNEDIEVRAENTRLRQLIGLAKAVA